jgi:hypothetical protein
VVLLSIACFWAWKRIAHLGLSGSDQELLFFVVLEGKGFWVFGCFMLDLELGNDLCIRVSFQG